MRMISRNALASGLLVEFGTFHTRSHSIVGMLPTEKAETAAFRSQNRLAPPSMEPTIALCRDIISFELAPWGTWAGLLR